MSNISIKHLVPLIRNQFHQKKLTEIEYEMIYPFLNLINNEEFSLLMNEFPAQELKLFIEYFIQHSSSSPLYKLFSYLLNRSFKIQNLPYTLESLGKQVQKEQFHYYGYHIFIDFSNIMIPFGTELLSHLPLLLSCFEQKNKNLEMEKQHYIASRFVAGSFSSSSSFNSTHSRNQLLVETFQKQFYTCDFSERSRSNREIHVDSILHLEMYKQLNTHKNSNNTTNLLEEKEEKQSLPKIKPVLVLVTGDGNKNNGRTDFPSLTKTFLEQGWIVHQWSWKKALSSAYKEFAMKYSDSYYLFYLDDFFPAFSSSPSSSSCLGSITYPS